MARRVRMVTRRICEAAQLSNCPRTRHSAMVARDRLVTSLELRDWDRGPDHVVAAEACTDVSTPEPTPLTRITFPGRRPVVHRYRPRARFSHAL